MSFIIVILLGLLLFLVVYQDFRFRAVSLILFPMILLLSFLHSSLLWSSQISLFNTAINFLFTTLQLLLVYSWFSFKNRKFLPVNNKYLGIGDVCFLYSITPIFQPETLIIFSLVALLLILIIYGIIILIKKDYQYKIPFAGLFAVLIIPTFTLQSFFPTLENSIVNRIFYSLSTLTQIN
jgi:hypothetical protein